MALTKIEVLKQALEARQDEVLMYQVNIDNFTDAIKHIEDSQDDDLSSFKADLEKRLSAETIQLKKAAVMLSVIEKRIALIAGESAS